MIEYEEFLKLVGLLTLSKTYVKELEFIEKSLRNITGELEECGHCMDATYSDYTAVELLNKLGIKVKPTNGT